MKARSVPSSVCYILLASISLPIATAIVPPSLHPGALPLGPQNLTVMGAPRCAFDTDWSSGYVVKKKDCNKAIENFQRNFERHGTQQFEFFSQSGKPRTVLPHIETPGCYDVGECSACVAMLTDFSEDKRNTLPGAPPQPWLTNDVSSPRELWDAAKLIGDFCIRDASGFGWASVGRGQSIGVFIWASGSNLERDVSRSQALGNPAPLVFGNTISSPLPNVTTS